MELEILILKITEQYLNGRGINSDLLKKQNRTGIYLPWFELDRLARFDGNLPAGSLYLFFVSYTVPFVQNSSNETCLVKRFHTHEQII